jgi:Voltage-dependent anion channel
VIILGIQRFGTPHCGPWLLTTVRILFRLYAAITLLSSNIHYIMLFAQTPIRSSMALKPAVSLLIFNMMSTSTVFSTIAEAQPREQRLPILVAGIAYQGLGWVLPMWFFDVLC